MLFVCKLLMKLRNFSVILIFLLLVIRSHILAGRLTQESLNSDLNYYYKTIAEKKLTANDKLYILNRIYEKYKNSGLDLTKLEIELDKVKRELNQQKISKTSLTQEITTKKPFTSASSNKEKYKISPGDILFIRVTPAEELSREVIVTADGTIVLQLVGNVKVDGMTVPELERLLEKLYSVYVSNPKVSITVKFFSKRQVFIMGEINKPGSYQYQENFKLLELISKAGGLTQFAGRNLKIYRGEKEKQQVITVNIDDVIKDPSKDIILEPNDIIEVPKEPKTISVLGEVAYPGTYEWYENMDILKALSLARGYTATAKLSSVKILRETSKGKQVIEVNVAKVLNGEIDKNVLLQPGDVVYVPRKPLVSGQWFVNTVLPWLALISSVLLIINYWK